MSGILRGAKNLIALSLLVAFLYGSLFWGIFPVKERVSWESHLWGAVVGFVLAWYYRKEGPQKKRYDWEDEDEEEVWDENFDWPDRPAEEKPEQRVVIHYQYKKNKDQNNKG